MKIQVLSIAILLLGAAGVANADQDNEGHWHADKSRDRFHDRSSPVLAAPEIDPISMVAALTLLGGALAVWRGRRSRS